MYRSTDFCNSYNSEPITEYQLNTIAYELGPSAYLSQRVIIQFVCNEQEKYPTSSHILSTQMYVNDSLARADSGSEALQLQSQLISLASEEDFFSEMVE